MSRLLSFIAAFLNVLHDMIRSSAALPESPEAATTFPQPRIFPLWLQGESGLNGPPGEVAEGPDIEHPTSLEIPIHVPQLTLLMHMQSLYVRELSTGSVPIRLK